MGLSGRQTAVATAAVGAIAAAGLVLGALRGPVQPQAGGRLLYVSPQGSDGNNGTGLDRPWRTLSKCAQEAAAGDSCLIRAGTYHETLAPAHSGTASARITFRPYKDERVTIDGADEVTGWQDAGGGVYTTSVVLPITTTSVYSETFGPTPATGLPVEVMANQVFLDDRMLREAQWPTAPVTYTSPLSFTFAVADNGTTSAVSAAIGAQAHIVDADLPITTTNFVGAVVHYWGGLSWRAETAQVSAQGLISGTPAITYTTTYPNWSSDYIGTKYGTRYYVLGTAPLFDGPAEWLYLPVTHTLALRTPQGDDPSLHLVRAKQRAWDVDLAGRSDLTVQGLQLLAGAVRTDDSSMDDVLSDLDVRYPTHMTSIPQENAAGPTYHFTGVILDGHDNVLQNSMVAYSAGNGVSLFGTGNVVANNLIHDNDYIGQLAGNIMLMGRDARIVHNTLYNTAQNGIDTDWSGSNEANHSLGTTRVAYNDIFRWGLVGADLGGFYQCCDVDAHGEVVEHNWVHDCAAHIPTIPSTLQGGYRGNGIYFDTGAHGQSAHHNVMWQTCVLGLATNASNEAAGNATVRDVTIANNTFADGTTTGVRITGSPGALVSQTAHASNMRYVNNLYVSASQLPQYLIGSVHQNEVLGGAVRNGGAHDYRPAAGSAAIDGGTTLAGITDGYVGTAPDAGAYESGAAPWRAGCTLPACAGADPWLPLFAYGATGGRH